MFLPGKKALVMQVNHPIFNAGVKIRHFFRHIRGLFFGLVMFEKRPVHLL